MLVKYKQSSNAETPILSQTLFSAKLMATIFGAELPPLESEPNKCAGIFVTFTPIVSVIPSPLCPALQNTWLSEFKSSQVAAL